jgi:hypothetical protein
MVQPPAACTPPGSSAEGRAAAALSSARTGRGPTAGFAPPAPPAPDGAPSPGCAFPMATAPPAHLVRIAQRARLPSRCFVAIANLPMDVTATLHAYHTFHICATQQEASTVPGISAVAWAAAARGTVLTRSGPTAGPAPKTRPASGTTASRGAACPSVTSARRLARWLGGPRTRLVVSGSCV